jgi:hypothetical protein
MTISIKSPTSTTGSIQKNGSDVITIDASDNVTVANGLTVSGNISTSGTIPAGQLTGDLPAISGANLTGLPAGYTNSDALTLFNASGSAPVYACRAWVNFNGTGTVAIRASGNVSSITDNGAGDYTVNFTTAMPDINYTTVVSSITMGGTPQVSYASLASYNSTAYGPTSSSVRVIQGGTGNSGGPKEDTAYFNVVIFR